MLLLWFFRIKNDHVHKSKDALNTAILVYKALWIPVIHNSNASLLVINDDFSGSRTDLIACSSNHSIALFCPRGFDYWWNYRQVQIEGNTIIKRLIKALGYQMSHIIFNADSWGILQSTGQTSYNAEIEAPKSRPTESIDPQLSNVWRC